MVGLVDDVAAHGGLAAARFPGQQSNAAQIDEVLEPRLGLAVGTEAEQLVGVRGGLERQTGQGEVAQVHQSCSSFSRRMLSGERGGSGAGAEGSMRPEGRSRFTAVLA